MLTISSNARSRDCEGFSRRDFLRIGALGLGGLTLPNLLAAKANASESGGFVRDKAVVFLFLHGGPSQYETWDPKMTAPSNIRSYTGEVQTRIPGVTFGGTFPRLGAMADRLAVVRSFRVGTGSHGTGRRMILGGGNSTQAPMGALYSSLAGTTHPLTGMPNNIVLPPRAAGPEHARLFNSTTEVTFTGSLSPEFRAFDPSTGNVAPAGAPRRNNRNRQAPPSGLLSDMQLRLPADRLGDRRLLLQQLSSLQRNMDQDGVAERLGRYRQQAFNVIMRGVREAFDLSQENVRTLERYDTSHMVVPERVLRKNSRNARRIPEFAPVALGRQMLLARRLVEAGCGFVTVPMSGWDMHGNAFGIDDGIPCLGPAVDHAVSAFLEDLEARGMRDRVLLIVAGEMGRTPRINNKAGRDHWANIASLMMAGGGLNMGQVVGQSDSQGARPSSTPITLNNLLATVMHTVFDIGELRVARGVPTDILRMATTTEPIRELVG